MTPLGRLPEPFWSAPFTVAEALEKGASYGELCHRDVVTLSRSIKILTDDADVPLALLTRPYTVVTGYAAASHATAFRIWEFPGFLPAPTTPTSTFHGNLLISLLDGCASKDTKPKSGMMKSAF